MAKDEHKTQITIAVVGLIGVLGTAIVANWDRIFPKPEPQPPKPTPQVDTNPVTPPIPKPVPSPRPLSISGMVFDKTSSRRLSAVSIHLYKDVRPRPQTFLSRVATTGPDGSFYVKLPNVTSQDLPLLIALSHSDWTATQITGVRITDIQDYSRLNIPVDVSTKSPASDTNEIAQDLSVSFSTRQAGTQYYVTGAVKNKSSRSFSCVLLRFDMSTSYQRRVAGEPPRPLGVLDVEVKDIGPFAEKTYRKMLPQQVGLGLKSVAACP